MKTPAAPLPASFFGIVLGLAGLGSDWREALKLWPLPATVGEIVLAFAGLVWLVLVLAYAHKWIYHRTAAIAEIGHPVACCFVGLAFVATLLIALALVPYSRVAALVLASVGWAGGAAFGVWRTGWLWQGSRAPEATTAVLYLPTVAGNFVASIVSGALGYEGLGALFFGAGFFAWLAIESVLLHRLYTTAPLALSIRATLGIQLAPSVVGCVAWLSINGQKPDLLAQGLVGYGIFQAAVLCRLLPWFGQQAFSASFWTFSFGITALALSIMRLTTEGVGAPLTWLALPAFGLANLAVGYLVIRTLHLLVTGNLLPAPTAMPAQDDHKA
ncbi:tellurite resistance protein [Paraburkholderia sp. CI2]|uniref:dicarboxylate transporter/tellurite-resistance protein TehA n=1 Tax=Paraburkholderia sp. CI2 TaxID=2723093 RepID=UPI0016140A32|nr:dicarboxylate transporter/tellurite-resistance protein TehA [Paraburkholderia sp. CI2]MBB5470540.1 tellurite resistance protein [Paraburkholderia sp. CI2]